MSSRSSRAWNKVREQPRRNVSFRASPLSQGSSIEITGSSSPDPRLLLSLLREMILDRFRRFPVSISKRHSRRDKTPYVRLLLMTDALRYDFVGQVSPTWYAGHSTRSFPLVFFFRALSLSSFLFEYTLDMHRASFPAYNEAVFIG